LICVNIWNTTETGLQEWGIITSDGDFIVGNNSGILSYDYDDKDLNYYIDNIQYIGGAIASKNGDCFAIDNTTAYMFNCSTGASKTNITFTYTTNGAQNSHITIQSEFQAFVNEIDDGSEYLNILEFARICKEENPNSITVMGGYHATMIAGEIMND
jgi:hypothetical protein